MSDLKKMREQRTALANEVRTLVKDHPEDAAWTDEHDEKYNNAVGAVEQLDAKIKRHENLLNMEAANRHEIAQSADASGLSTDEMANNDAIAKGALNSWLRGGVENLTEDQREFVKRRNAEVGNTMSTTTGAEGGFVTRKEFAPSLLESLKSYGGMRKMATVLQTETGSAMDFPTADATSEEGEIVGENADVSDEDTTFGTLSHQVYKFSSKGVAVPFELLQDSQIDIESYIRKILVTRLGRTTERLFTGGSGTAEPYGIVGSAGSGKVGASGQVTTVTYDDLIDLEHSVDPAYRDSGDCGFMFHDTTLRELRKLKDNNGVPIWLPGLSSADPNNILNRPYAINQNMDVMAANAKSILFGDYSKYIIRDVSALQLFRFTDSAYTKKGQVGFLAFMRSGGRLMDTGGAVKFYQNASS